MSEYFSKLVAAYNPEIEVMGVFRSTVGVVEFRGKKYILKEDRHGREGRALDILTGVRGFPELYDTTDVRVENFLTRVVLKSFTPGQTLTQMSAPCILGAEYESACMVLEEAHKRGIANLDIHQENMLIRKKKSHFFDLDRVWFEDALSSQADESLRTQDKRDLYRCFERKKLTRFTFVEDRFPLGFRI